MLKNSELFKVVCLLKKRAPIYFLVVTIKSLIQAVCLNIILAYLMKDAVNAIMTNDWVFLERAILVAIISLAIGMVVMPSLNFLISSCSEKTIVEFKVRTYKHIGKLVVSSMEKHHTGDIINRTTVDIEDIDRIFKEHIPMLFFAIIFGVLTMISIFTMEFLLGIIVVLAGILSIVINLFFGKAMKRVVDRIQGNKSKLTQGLVDILEGFQTLKIFHIESYIFNKYKANNKELFENKDIENKLSASVRVTYEIFSRLRYFCLLFIGLLVAIEARLDIGSVAAIIHLQGNASYFFDNIGNFIIGTKKSLAGSSRVFAFLNTQVEEDKDDILKKNENNNPLICCKKLGFQYDNDNRVLNDVNIEVKKGDICAIVGVSGSGKSTLFKLLLGFYKQTQGDIMIAGNSINDYSLHTLRDMIAYVPQDAYLFSGTILENIRYGKIDATFSEIEQCAKLAYAHDFIMELPDGYNTEVGERGAKLSGGERQRIAIARALLKNAPILLLDEATSALDSESQTIVEKAIEVLLKGRTTLIISHRLNNIHNANVIYVLNKGVIEESGTHKELISKNGLYNHLYQLQFKKDCS